MVDKANEIWADGPSSAPYEPYKPAIRSWGSWIEGVIAAFFSTGGRIYQTRALLNADLTATVNTVAWVMEDPTAANNGIYRKVGGTGSGSWTRAGDLPFSFIVASNPGSGTANAIQVTTSMPVSSSALVILPVAATNTTSPVTVAFNGGSTLTIKSNSGNDIVAGGVVAGMQLLGVVSGSTFRLVSDQVSAAIVAAAEDAADRAEAAAAGVTLPSAVASTYLRQKSDMSGYETLTAAQLREDIDPLKVLSGDGVTDDTANFTALRALYPKEDFDLDGRYPLVSALPVGPFRNGGFSVANYEGAAKAVIPTPDLIKVHMIALSAGAAQALWAQDKSHSWDGVLYLPYIEGTQHSTSDPFKYIVFRRYQHGVFSAPERLFRIYDGVGRSSFSAGVTDGVQWVYLRNDITLGQKLFARRLPQRYELTRCIDTTIGSPEIDIDFADAGVVIGAVEGMKAIFGNVGTVGGLAITGEYTVSFVNGNRIQFTHGSNASATVSNGGGTGGEGGVYFNLYFNETPFQEITIGGGDVGAAIATAFNGGTAPVNIHSFAPLLPTSAFVADDGSHLVGVSGGDVNIGIAKILRPMDTNGSVGGKTVAFVAQIPGGTHLSEPTVTSEGDVTSSKLRGFCRTQSESDPSIFWTADLNGSVVSNFQTWDMDIGANVQSPIPLIVMGDDIFALCSATRYGQNNGDTGLKATPVDMYLLHAKKADADANGWAAFKRFVVTQSFFANHFFAVNNGVGVGSLVQVDESTIMAVFGIEATGENPAIGPSRIYAALIDVSNIVGQQRKYPLPIPQVIDLDSGYWQYVGLPAVATGGYLTFTTPISQTAPVIFDTVTGYITAVEVCTLAVDIQVEYGAGTVGERYCEFVDEAGTNLLGATKLAKENTRSTDGADYKDGSGSFVKQFRPGEKGRFRVTAPNGTRATADSSILTIRKV